ncbi:hypothetical protein AVEN_4628-1 [Araneus ventricosus]|uniref:RNase H type-1 domain-containing protein n=1 Tax=Araneus ventricosus TaxID=182803 RepID=A0A4Y2D414_ARAVE|nr:hypothetical protein AVEN_4628-1 [Araneus ventricosus]
MASSNSKSTNETARKIFKILLTNPRIAVSWVKAYAGNIGNERADQLAKDATQHGQPYSLIKLPKPHIKGLLRNSMLEEWQTSWKNGDTGRKIYNIMPSVSLLPTNWIGEDVIFFSQHGLFLPTSKGFTCLTAIFAAVVELARHFPHSTKLPGDVRIASITSLNPPGRKGSFHARCYDARGWRP